MTPRFLAGNLARLLIRRELAFEFDRIPLRARGVSGRKLANLAAVGVNRLLGRPARALGYPYMAHVSPSGLCNLRCAICPAHDPEARGKALLPFATFRKLVDEAGDYLLYIILWSWGEPFLNPEIDRMIRYAGERNILTVTSSNLDRLDADQARRIVASGLDALIIALDGTTEESHAKYRRGGSAARVIDNTRLLVEEKRRRGAAKPLLNLRMVVSRENETEIGAFRELAVKIGVDMVSFKAFSTRQPGYADPELDRRYAPVAEGYRWYRYRAAGEADRTLKRYACRFPWTKPTLFPDGEVLACEFDLREAWSFGNLNRQSFREIWFGPRAREFRRIFMRNRDDIAYCRDCVYDYRRIPGCVVGREILRP